MALLYFFIIPVLYPLFKLSPSAGDICTMMLTLVFCFLPLRSFDTTNIVGVLRGGGDVRTATIIDLAPLWVVAIPLAALAGVVLQAGIVWVYLAMMSESVVKSFIGFGRFRTGKWVRDVTLPDLREAV